jgi:hypothetical protein
VETTCSYRNTRQSCLLSYDDQVNLGSLATGTGLPIALSIFDQGSYHFLALLKLWSEPEKHPAADLVKLSQVK